MKLVDILARELKAWPESWGIYCVSSKVDGAFAAWFGYRNPVFEDGGWSDIGTVEIWLSEEPEDRKNVVVRRFEWQAAVDKLKAEVHTTESMALHHQEVGRITRQWSGEGLPPVGIDVEVFAGYSHSRFDRFIGQRVHIIAHDVINGDPVAVFRMPIDGDDAEQDYHAMVASSFRPIRTPEQIAAEERAAGIQALKAIFDSCSDELMPTSNKYLDTLFGAIHDAGYRKFEIVDN